MIPTTISLRICLFTDRGPAGWRLERGTPLPVREFDFPATKEGHAAAKEAQQKLQEYVTKHHEKKKPRK